MKLLTGMNHRRKRRFMGSMSLYPRRVCLLVPLLSLCVALTVQSQTVAILAIEADDLTQKVAERLAEGLSGRLKLLDPSMAQAAYASKRPTDAFNMTVEEGKRIGSVTGSNAFLIVRSSVQRRSAFGKPDYFEAYSVICGVSSRTGRLVYWKLHSFEAGEAKTAVNVLVRALPDIGSEIASSIEMALRKELVEPDPPRFDEAPNEDGENGTRTPVPYRRLRPDYTAMASLYGVAATVDMLVYLDQSGKIIRTELVRWAGFGLDESVEGNIRSMNWRPAERNGKPIAAKFLVRYNFRKIDRTAN